MNKDQITAWAREAGITVFKKDEVAICDVRELARFAALAYAAGAAEEREACAKVCEAEAEKQYDNMDIPLTIAADLIRARGNT